ncbi:hypothetical protein Daura_14430 [Dactylosporangium aurantiacum]|uniref:FtsX-like permease family protein n=1 Tax=Dactylosporangium aurantiacum TaxID=35754 RepID=A0A9Q9IKJ0_9ACTN|nr:hypothetical protein [Dactylosporangium aurantiacum]MDG6108590.1 hypothetical protein [Dactylosporangium aurantiacum]UWZ57256.1 hypothetical protein Daura_14430 [Dactylosporangium aurantiacum]
MIGLVLAMLWSRRGRAATVMLLTALATAGALAAPVYLARADDRIVRTEVAGAAASERTVLITGEVQSTGGGSMAKTFESLAGGWLDTPGYATVFSAQFTAQPGELEQATAAQLSTVMFREGICEHVRVVAGRCLMGTGDTVLTERTAGRLGLRPGDTVSLAGSRYDSVSGRYTPAGAPTSLTVVGVVVARDGAEPYWGRAGGSRDAFQVDRRTLDTFARPSELQSFDAYPLPGAITVETLPALREWVQGAQRRSTDDARLNTDLDVLLDRIAERRAELRDTVPFAVAPVLLLAWAVITLAVSTVIRARRFEHGVIALRGVARPGRWWLATGETLLSVLVGALLGFTAAGGWQTRDAWPYATVAVLGALAVAVTVALRTVSAPVSALLRQVDRRTARWRGFALEGLLVVAAVVAVGQVRGRPGGVALLAPALVMLAVAVVAGRVVPVLSGLAAGRALRRRALGRVRLAGVLAGLRLARRPVGARLLVLLTLAVGSLAFAAAATAAVDERQRQQADLDTGAPVVLTVDATSRVQLLRAVRAADPDGRSAMAVVPIRLGEDGAAAAVAVDAPRLAAVALWPGGAGSAADVAARLHPPSPGTPVILTGATLTLDVTASTLDRPDVVLAATLAPLDGRPTSTVELGRLVPGRQSYTAPTPICTAGCRLVEIAVRLPSFVGPTVVVTLHAPPTTDWRVASGASAAPGAGGITFTLPATTQPDAGVLRPAGSLDQLPVVTAVPLPDATFKTFGSRPVPAAPSAAARLPRVGTGGALVDLEYADLLAADDGRADGAEVWLSATAPPTVVDALRAQGLTVTGRRTVADARAAIAAGGTALGLRFYLFAGVLSATLGAAGLAVAAIGTTTADLRALRVQGLRRATGTLVEPLVVAALVTAAGLAGVVAAAVAWLAVGGTLPGLAGTGVPPLGVPAVTVAGTLVLLAVAGLTAQAAAARR